MIREGGVPIDELFDRVRLRVSDVTQGAQVPWHATNGVGPFVFFERTAEAPPLGCRKRTRPQHSARERSGISRRRRHISRALERDTLPDYLEFLDSYANSPLANRVRAIVAVRREAA